MKHIHYIKNGETLNKGLNVVIDADTSIFIFIIRTNYFELYMRLRNKKIYKWDVPFYKRIVVHCNILKTSGEVIYLF